jgi:hypothetical protein
MNSKNFLNLKSNENIFKKSISSSPQVDSIIKKEKRFIEVKNIPEKKHTIFKKEKQTRSSVLDVANKKENAENNTSMDDNRRMFLKVAGVAGLGLAASALFPKSADAYVSGSTPTSNVVGLKDSTNNRIDPAKETGGNLATIKTNTDPFATAGAGGYIRQDSTATIAKETGGNLAAVKTNTDKFTFDANNNLLIGSTVTGATNIGSSVNDQGLWMLRKIITLLKPLGMTTGAQSNRLAVDVVSGGAVATVTTVTTVGTVTNLTNIGNINAFSLMKDSARNAYANSIRSKLSF